MKKILLGLGLEQRKATCSFCGEDDKECIKGNLPLKVSYKEPKFKIGYMFKEHPEMKEVIKGYKFGFFGDRFISHSEYEYVGDYTVERVVEKYEEKTVTDEADICTDCIKQLAKLI